VAEKDARERLHQMAVMRALVARMEAGEGALPTDVFAPIEQELEDRADDDEIAAAWDEQGAKEAVPWVFARSDILR
jgi:hypothetical protein